jgi:Flp pilus assembly protein TadD
MKGIRHQLGRDQLAKAIAELDVKIQATQDTELYFQRASVKFLDLQLNSALLDLDTYLAAKPNAVAPLMLKGKILSFYDRFDEADAVFNLAAVRESSCDTLFKVS